MASARRTANTEESPVENEVQCTLTKLNPLLNWSSMTSWDSLVTSLCTQRSASSSKTTGGAGVEVVEEVRNHSRTRSSLLMQSMRSWIAWNMLKAGNNKMEMSAPLKCSLEIEDAQSDEEQEMKSDKLKEYRWEDPKKKVW